MPAQKKTTLGLNQWIGSEYPKRIDFVEDNKIINDELENRVKYTDLATETVPGIITYAKIKEIAPKPDLSPYLRYDQTLVHTGNNIGTQDFIIRSNKNMTFTAHEIAMFEGGDANKYWGSFHVNGGRAYYRVPGRNNGQWCEIMDNHDIYERDRDRADLRGHINRLWTARDTDTVLNIRLAGYIQAEVQRNEMRERNGYVVTGGINDDRNYTLDYLQFRALQMYRAGNWVNVPFV